MKTTKIQIKDTRSNPIEDTKLHKERKIPGQSKIKNPFTQLCVWEGTVVGPNKIKEFEDWILGEFKTRIKYSEEIKTKPDMDDNNNPVPKTGERNDLFFYCHYEDLSKFAVPRLSVGIRWWEDVLGNGNGKLYPDKILEKYSPKWNKNIIAKANL